MEAKGDVTQIVLSLHGPKTVELLRKFKTEHEARHYLGRELCRGCACSTTVLKPKP
jgi:hypothetical protein